MQIYEPGEEDPITPQEEFPPTSGEDDEPIPAEPGDDETVIEDVFPDPFPPGGKKKSKIYVDGVSAEIIAERVEYLDENGKLITESLRDFTRKALQKQ